MARFSVKIAKSDGRSIIELADAEAGTAAKIACDLGFNCCSFVKKLPDGPGEYIYSSPEFLAAGRGVFGSGIPILFPFPNRIKGGLFTFAGKEIAVPKNEGGRNAIHGLVAEKPWQLLATDTSAAALATGRIDTAAQPELLAAWPLPFALEVTYRLAGDTLAMEAVMKNPGPGVLPCGFGTHGYFTLPGQETVERISLAAPVGKRWKLDNLIPTGELEPLPPEDADLPKGVAIGKRSFDTVYGAIAFEAGRAACSLAAGARRLTLGIDATTRVLVIYTPPHRRYIAIEPYTCVTDAFNLAARGVDGGAYFLAPGAEARTMMTLTVA